MLFLGLGDLNDHLCSGMFDVHLLEDGRTVVGDDHVSHGVHEHLVHALGSQGGANSIGHGLRSSDVVGLCCATSGSLSAVFENENRSLSVAVHLKSRLGLGEAPFIFNPALGGVWKNDVKPGRFVQATFVHRHSIGP